MSEQAATNPGAEQQQVSDKGKGKSADAQHPDVSMDEDDSSDESGDEQYDPPEEDVEEEDEDNMEEIDTDNIIGDRRTRGKSIDFAKAAQETPDEDDDDEDDDDFQDPDDEMKD